MAKKRRQKIEKKEDYVFKKPDFPKDEFVRNELRSAKATVIAFFFGILIALISHGFLRALDDFRVGAILGIFAMAALPFVFNALKMDMGDFEKKSWLGVFATYFFTWLMISILISNPPIYDRAEPAIRDITLEQLNENITNNQTFYNWVGADSAEGNFFFYENHSFRIIVVIWDNYKLNTNTIKCELMRVGGGEYTAEAEDMGNDKFSFEFKKGSQRMPKGDYEYLITAKDKAGNTAEERGKFQIIEKLS
ncbi:MAG: hypothetical protein JSV49_10750 [Thermoplasmata archaeon]|nr:MAG: hypothetical protein JSV49_10750 [Thermoplasmata archaeon]